MRIRLGHRGSRLVLPIARTDGAVTERRWLAVHVAPHDWARIFERALHTLDLAGAPGVELDWRPGRFSTTITLRLTTGSEKKRALIAGALLRAARYLVL